MSNTHKTWKAWNAYYPDDPITNGNKFHIHHIDRNDQNNARENLRKMTCKKHIALHHKDKIVSEKTREKMSKARKGTKLPDSTKQKMRDNRKGTKNPMYGRKQSEETKQKIALTKKGKKASEETKIKMSLAHTKRHQERRALCQ